MKNVAKQRITLQHSLFLFCKSIPKVTSSLEIAAGNNDFVVDPECLYYITYEDMVRGFNVIFTECA